MTFGNCEQSLSAIEPGALITVQTTLGGKYERVKECQAERDGGGRPEELYACDLAHSGKFIGILKKGADFATGPFVDNYIQLEIIGEKAVLSRIGNKITGWEIQEKVMSIPLRNVKSISINQ